MNTFPANRIATQPQAVVFEDARCLSLAAIKVDGVPVPRSTLIAIDGLWPTFTAEQSVLYYRTPAGDVVTFSPTGAPLALGTTYPIAGDDADPAALTALIQALVDIGLPIEYFPPTAAVLDSISPAAGTYAGGTPVTLVGSGFYGSTGVTFDGTPGTSFVVVDDEHITVISPAHAPGAVDVIVTDPNGNSDPATFTYGPPLPTITPPLVPATGGTAGGTAIVLTGTGLTGATGVTFGGVAGTAFSVVNATTINVTTPAHAAGAVNVVVQAPQGNSAAAVGAFTYA